MLDKIHIRSKLSNKILTLVTLRASTSRLGNRRLTVVNGVVTFGLISVLENRAGDIIVSRGDKEDSRKITGFSDSDGL